MSSACPRGRNPDQPTEYIGEYKEMDYSLRQGGGKFTRFFQIQRKGVGEFEIL